MRGKRSLLLGLCIIFSFSVFFGINWLSLSQKLALGIFFSTVIATLLFWKYHLPIAFLGVGALFLTRTLDIGHFITFASLDLIIFLIGMMVLMGFLREADFFTWLLEKILLIRNLTSWKLFAIIIFISFLLTFLVGQVAAVIFVTSLVFEICGFFGINPLPFIMMTLMSVNIGSAGSLLGSPAGMLLATGVGLRFEDFLIWSFPVALSSLLAGTLFLLVWYRGELKRAEVFIRGVKGVLEDRSFRQLVNFPATREIKEEIFLLGVVFTLLALHFQIEEFFSLPPNTLLVAVPLIGAGIAMGWKKEEARRYIEEHVDWWTVVFFILFFAKAGTFSYTGITSLISSFIQEQAKLHPLLLITEITWISSFASSIMDNVVVVSILMPAIKAIANEKFIFPFVNFLWWGLFLGGCFGSITTMIGSPANIVALGMLERHEKIKVGLFEWVKVGILLTLLTTSVATLELIVFSLLR